MKVRAGRAVDVHRLSRLLWIHAKRFEAAWWCGLGRIVAVPLVGQIGGKFFFNGRIPFFCGVGCG